MKRATLKRLLSLLMALTMLLGCVSALAEGESQEDCTESPTAESAGFWQNLRGKLQQADLSTHQLKLTVPQAVTGTDDVVVSLQSMKGLASLLLSEGDRDVAELQSDGSTIWFSISDLTYAMDVQELAELCNDVLGMNPTYLLMSSEDFRNALALNLMSLYQYVLADHITVSQIDGGGTSIVVQLSGRDLLDGLANYLDSLADADDLARSLGIREGSLEILAIFALAVSGQTGVASENSLFREGFRAAAARLREKDLDLTILAVLSVTSGDMFEAKLNATVMTNGTVGYIDGALTVAEDSGSVSLRLYDNSSEYERFTGEWNTAGDVKTFTAVDTMEQRVITVNATLSDHSLRVDAFAESYSRLVFSGSLTAVYADGTLLVSLNGTDLRKVVSAELYLTQTSLKITCRADRENYEFTVSADAQSHPWSLKVTSGSSTVSYSWDGESLSHDAGTSHLVFTPHEISDAQYAIDITSTYDSYYDSYYGSSSETSSGRLLLSLTDGDSSGLADGWTLTFSVESAGKTLDIATLEYTAQRVLTPLSSSKTVQTITREQILQLLQLLLTASHSPNQYTYPESWEESTVEDAVEEAVLETVEAVEEAVLETVEAVEEAVEYSDSGE